MEPSTALEKGRDAFRKGAWSDACALLSYADRHSSLDPADLKLLARATYLAGREAECIDIWMRSHYAFNEQKDLVEAANCAFWMGLILSNLGDHAQASGWMARARRLIEECGEECVEQGFLLIPEALEKLRKGQAGEARQLFEQAMKLGGYFNSPDLLTLGRLGCGQSLIQQNDIERGTTLFDEAMIAVVADEVSPIVAGIVYCAVIASCRKIYDLRRAKEWTAALSHWCDTNPDLVPYRGQCLVRRAEIMQVHGQWPEAMNELQQACKIAESSSPPATGAAHYRQAEMYRLQGKYVLAEEKYRSAHKMGHRSQPGLALLRLARGQVDSAVQAIRLVEEEKQDHISRSGILPAFIDIMIAAGDAGSAQEAAAELAGIAEHFRSPYLQAIAERSLGAVKLANGDAVGALKNLEGAWILLNDLEASYDSARTRKLIGLAYREVGDTDTAEMEFNAARWTFEVLGAAPDLEMINSLLSGSSSEAGHGLTDRELEVLRHLCTGKTNKDIAHDLFISRRTVDRHVSNILAKLNVPTRAAATAYAYQHDLV